MNDLTDKQQSFIEEYLIDLNATQAAIRAGYNKKTARQIGAENLSKPVIQEAINAAMARRSKRTEITADKVLQQLAKIAFADIKDFVEFGPKEEVVKELEDGTKIINIYPSVRIKPSDQVDGSILAEVSEGRDGIKIKRNDQVKALELLGKHLAIFNDKLDISGVKMVVFNGDDKLTD